MTFGAIDIVRRLEVCNFCIMMYHMSIGMSGTDILVHDYCKAKISRLLL